VPGTIDTVWRAQDTTPGAIEAAMREMLNEIHARSASYVPARVLNLVCIVDREWSGEIANRLRQVGRFHPSRTIVCAVAQARKTLDATATIAAPADPAPGDLAVLRETVIVDCGTQHLPNLDTIVSPLVVSDVPTCVWSPHRHPEGVKAVLPLSQIVLLDSVEEPDPQEAVHRARELADDVYVVDLAWLRSTPWRERIAATFDPVKLRPDLRLISSVTVRHHPESAVAALLLVGWLASRLGWSCGSPLLARGGALVGRASTRRQEISLRLESDIQQRVPGLAGLTLETASGRCLSLDRGPGGLRARYRHVRGTEREWTVLGASRGEAGILAEGIRNALVRDPTYRPALERAGELVG
jgi:glucose-6-phosphate dehydrogenase assembly protein OpcA